MTATSASLMVFHQQLFAVLSFASRPRAWAERLDERVGYVACSVPRIQYGHLVKRAPLETITAA